MSRPQPLLLLCLLCLLAYEMQDVARHIHRQFVEEDLKGNDFPVYHDAARRLLDEPSTLYDIGGARGLGGYTYPPLSILLFLPFAPLRQPPAIVLFDLVSVAALLLSCLLVLRARLEPGARESRAQAACFTLLVVTSGPSFCTIVLGQVNMLVVLLCVGAVYLSQRHRPVPAGIALAFACWIKIYPALLVVAMLGSRTHRRSGAMATAFGLLLPACFLWLVPFRLYAQYFLEVLPALSGSVHVNVYNQSIVATLLRSSIPFDQWMTWTPLKAALWIRIVNALVLLGAMALFFAGRVRRSQDFLLVSLLALSLAPLVGPLSWGHSFLFAMLLVSYCAVFLESAAGRALAFLAWLMLLPPAYSSPGFLGTMPQLVQKAVHFRYPVAVALVFGVALARLARAGAMLPNTGPPVDRRALPGR